MNTRDRHKLQIPIEDIIKAISKMKVENPKNPEIKELQKKVDYFYWGIII